MAINQPQYETFGSGLAAGLSKGLQEQFVEPEQQRQKAKLQLAMESARIQAEQASRMREMQYGSQLGGLTGQQLGGVSSLFGASPEAQQGLSAVFPNGAGAEQSKSILGALGSASRVPVQMVSSEGPNGEKIVTPFQRGKQMGGPQNVGYSPAAASKISAAKTAFNSGASFVQDLRQTVGGFLGAQSAADLPAQVVGLKLNQILQNNPKAKAYFDGLVSTALTQEKDMTGTAREASSIIKGFAKSLPQMDDTAATALAKIDKLEQRINRAASATAKSYKMDPSEFGIGQEQQPQAQGNNSVMSAVTAELARRQGKR